MSWYVLTVSEGCRVRALSQPPRSSAHVDNTPTQQPPRPHITCFCFCSTFILLKLSPVTCPLVCWRIFRSLDGCSCRRISLNANTWTISHSTADEWVLIDLLLPSRPLNILSRDYSARLCPHTLSIHHVFSYTALYVYEIYTNEALTLN